MSNLKEIIHLALCFDNNAYSCQHSLENEANYVNYLNELELRKHLNIFFYVHMDP